MTKKQVETKKTKKNVDSKKVETKKVDKKVVKKEETKKENKFKTIIKNIGGKLKAFFNHPAPLIVALIALNLCSLLYITQYEGTNIIYVGNISKTVSVGTVHYFANNDINYFYASSAMFLEEDAKIYSYELGYYVKDGDKLVPFATRSGALANPTSLASVVNEQSGWEIPEAYNAKHFFTKEVVKNMDELYFVINASTKNDESTADIHYEVKVDTTKVTK